MKQTNQSIFNTGLLSDYKWIRGAAIYSTHSFKPDDRRGRKKKNVQDVETRPVQDRLYTDLKQGGVLFMPVSGVYDDRDYGWMAMEIGLSTAIYLAKRHRLSMVYCRSKDGGSISIQYWKSHYDKWYWLQEEKERTVISSKDLFTSISEIFEFTIPRDFVSVENHVKSLVLSRMNDAEAITRHKRSLRGGFDAYICTKILYGNHNELKV